MLNLALCRARAALPAAALAERRRLGAEVLVELRALARDVERILPELGSLARFALRPEAAALTVGWCPATARRGDVHRISLAAHADRLEVAWGLGAAATRGEREGRARWVAEAARRRRSLGDTVPLQLAALRAAGAELRGSHREPGSLAEDEWMRAAAGVVVFVLGARDLPEGELLARRVADRVAHLAWLLVHLGGVALPSRVEAAQSPADAVESLRALRWDERALGAGAPPPGLVPMGRAFCYDPATGWFAPAALAGAREMSAARLRLVTEAASAAGDAAAGDRAAGDPGARGALGVVAPVGAGLHARLGPWLAARGVRGAVHHAGAAEVVAAGELPRPGEVPALEALMARAMEDPSGDTAAALAGLLLGAPWRYGSSGDPLDPAAVAARVPPRFAAAAARGVARLTERGVLARGVTGSLGATGDCLAHPAVRPVLVGAVERALGNLDVFPPGARERDEARAVRAWELGAGAGLRAATLESVARRFVAYARATGMAFDLDLVRAFVVGLRAKPFAVLSGVSGTGKTRLAQLFARFMTEGLAGGSAARVALVPVRPDWLDSRGLLGYFNVLAGSPGSVGGAFGGGGGAYEDTAALRVILRAARHLDEPHFLVLDEMNLARVEHYLAEVLSAMESGEGIPLHGRPGGVATVDGAREVPPAVELPPNLFLLGTVNVNETTHAFSTKVLDRAWVWEFAPAPPTALLREWLAERRTVAPADEDERRALLGGAVPEDPVRPLVLAMGRDGVGARIDRVFDAMAAGGKPFGFRVATEVLRFVYLCEREGIETPPAWWLDRALLGKVLPRLSGTRRDLESLLRALLEVCAPVAVPGSNPGSNPGRAASGVADGRGTVPGEDLAATAAKLREMRARLETDPYVTFTR